MASMSKTKDKKKSKKSTRSSTGETSRRKDSERKSRDNGPKSSSTKDKTLVPPAVTAAPATLHDPDAIQLFRRYDRNCSGALTRLDFLQLLKDFAAPTTNGRSTFMSKPPLSLTDTTGIPLGFQRANVNSEFEAGQLFERYDRNHTGALTMDAFHVFFADFKPQLRRFVEESNYRLLAPSSISVAPQPLQAEEEEPVAMTANAQDTTVGVDDQSPKAIRAKYRAALWKLRRICKHELLEQREHLVRQMKAVRANMARCQQQSSRSVNTIPWVDPLFDKRRLRASHFMDFGEDGVDSTQNVDDTSRYEAMEDDMDRLDELVRYVRRFLNKGADVSLGGMKDFVEHADKMEEEAQYLAMKDYSDVPLRVKPEKEKENEPPSPTPVKVRPSSVPLTSSQRDLESLLRVKDQMIYQLLQERTTMRKERAAVEASLQDLSDVSTREMKKWARLTDDMQAEIEHLRSKLRSQS